MRGASTLKPLIPPCTYNPSPGMTPPVSDHLLSHPHPPPCIWQWALPAAMRGATYGELVECLVREHRAVPLGLLVYYYTTILLYYTTLLLSFNTTTLTGTSPLLYWHTTPLSTHCELVENHAIPLGLLHYNATVLLYYYTSIIISFYTSILTSSLRRAG